VAVARQGTAGLRNAKLDPYGSLDVIQEAISAAGHHVYGRVKIGNFTGGSIKC